MKRLICLICLISFFIVSVQSKFGTGNLLYGQNFAWTSNVNFAKRAEEFHKQLDMVNVLLGILEKKDTLNSEQRELQKELLHKREVLLASIRLAERLNSAAIGGRTLVFDAPEGMRRQEVDFLADQFGLNFEKKSDQEFLASFFELLQLDESFDELINRPSYKKISAKEKSEIQKTTKEAFSSVGEQLKQLLGSKKFEYVGLRKGLRGKDWIVFRVTEDVGDLGYYMVAYDLSEDGALRLEPLFMPNSGKSMADQALAGVKKILDQMVNIPNETYTMPSDDLQRAVQCLLNEDHEGMVAIYDEHPEYLGKNINYDAQYLNSLQGLLIQTLDEQERDALNEKLMRAVQNFRKNFPGNIMPDLMLLSVYTQMGNEECFLQCTNHLREAVINDPAIYWQESLFYFVHGDAKTGLAKVRQAKEEGYQVKKAYEFLLDFVEDGSEEMKELKEIIDNIGVAIPKFTTND